MKEVNEAYDAIVKSRTQGGYQSQSAGGYGGGGPPPKGEPLPEPHPHPGAPAHCPEQLGRGGRILRSTPANNAEWYYLMGSIAYRKGWMDDARQNFWTACNMEPSNMEYRQALNAMGMQAQRGAYGGGDDIANLCTTLSLPQLPVQLLQRLRRQTQQE